MNLSSSKNLPSPQLCPARSIVLFVLSFPVNVAPHTQISKNETELDQAPVDLYNTNFNQCLSFAMTRRKVYFRMVYAMNVERVHFLM